MRRRDLLIAALPASVAAAVAAEEVPVQRIATAWRPADDQPYRVGVIELDWAAAVARIVAETEVPSRAHGLLALPDGGFVAVAYRPGRWLMRFDASGHVVGTLRLAPDSSRSLNGHVERSADGARFYATTTDATNGRGGISVIDAGTLQVLDEFGSGGVEPHQLLRDGAGHVWVANGGVTRDAAGRKVESARLESSLVRIDPRRGVVLGQWRLDDPLLSLRHLAWSSSGEALGVALQAEHDDAQRRRDAPTLAVWRDGALSIATRDAGADGYAGDIAAGPGDGYIISAQKSRRCLWWHEASPMRYQKIAELTEACALASWDGGRGALIGAARGVARWHVRAAPGMLAWPAVLAPDNHAVLLRRA